MNRMFAFLYGVIAYCMFLAAILYTIAFVGDFAVPKTIDRGGPDTAFWPALAINMALMGLFAVQHSSMARRGFKRWLTRFMPEAIERSTFVMASSLIVGLLVWQWRPIPDVVWQVESTAATVALYAMQAAGWGMVFLSTFLINHFDLFGLRQVFLHLRGRQYTPIGYRTPLLYRLVRHPLMLGFLIAFWSTPIMTVGHLLFAATITAYILIALQLEERDLVRDHGDSYRTYQQSVPMLIPFLRGRRIRRQPQQS